MSADAGPLLSLCIILRAETQKKVIIKYALLGVETRDFSIKILCILQGLILSDYTFTIFKSFLVNVRSEQNFTFIVATGH